MTIEETQSYASVGKTAWRGVRRHFDAVSTITAVQLLVRVLAFSPLLVSSYFGQPLPAILAWIAVAALYIALVIPLRFWAKEKMRRLFYTRNLPAKKRNPYQKWLLTGLLRYGRGLLWGLPFLAGCAYFIIGKSTLNYTDMWQPVQTLAVLVGQKPNIGAGAPVALALMALFGLLFSYGWWRDLAFEYLPVRSIGPTKTLHWARRILKNHRREMRKNAWVNALLSLPAWIGVGAVLGPYVASRIDFSLSRDLVLNLILRLLKTPLPLRETLLLLAVFFVLYLPLCVLRKTRNAVLMARLMKESGHHHHEHISEDAENHAAG